MRFEGFTQNDFATFNIEGLDNRMEAIQKRIQPKFQEIGTELVDHLAARLGNEMFLHIARHARRTVNPPKDTWLAIADNKRGYKQHPHFQVGLFDDHVFIWFALIYELPHKTEIAKAFLSNIDEIRKQIPTDYVVSLDHTKKDAVQMKELDLKAALERFRDVKKAEFLVGQHLNADDKRLTEGMEFIKIAKETIDNVLPLYSRAMKAR
ncbi:YktB family protein [Virgibacillus oceani]|uniref:UPF0637 protein GCM10011398_12720 n=1 Tax=Virgibacillus oceani TaxID=1479511 RepID=A0A917LZY8_9BACI|nr:DUF1054 domain-containing protein [Virgibacillus oceani]GGG70126.1 UPF0637 protein [Virgibacillus oceani]